MSKRSKGHGGCPEYLCMTRNKGLWLPNVRSKAAYNTSKKTGAIIAPVFLFFAVKVVRNNHGDRAYISYRDGSQELVMPR